MALKSNKTLSLLASSWEYYVEVVTNAEVLHFYTKKKIEMVVYSTVKLHHVIVKDHMLHLGHVVGHY